MKKEIKEVDKKNKVLRITTLNERWYARPTAEKKTGLPVYEYLPSVTWIAGYYPKGVAFYKWLANLGWDEAEAEKQAAGDKGSKVHYACEAIDKGLKIDIQNDCFPNPTIGELEPLTPEEIECVMSFVDWTDATKAELLANELTIFGEGYAGTIDKIYRIGGEVWIVDLKTGQNIWEESKLQISAYSHAKVDYEELGITEKEWKQRKLGILQLGYRRNQNGYKFTEAEDKFDLFLMAKAIWANENPEAKPKEKDYPLTLQSEVRAIKDKDKK